MADAPPVDQAPEPGDTFIELRDGVPYIGTELEVSAKARAELVRLFESAASKDVTDALTIKVTADWHYNPAELRDPKTGKWIRDPAGHYLDAVAHDLKFQQRVAHNGNIIDRTKAGFTVKLKTGERQHYEHAEDAAEAARRGKHLAPGELKHGESHLTETKTGLTPDGRPWTATIRRGGIGSTYEISANPANSEQFRDKAMRATYLGDGKVKLEYFDNGSWVEQPGSAGGVTVESLTVRSKVYQAIAEHMKAAQKAAEDTGGKPHTSVPPYAPWNDATANHDAVKEAMIAPLPGQSGSPASPEAKAYVAERVAAKLGDMKLADLIASLNTGGYNQAQLTTFLSAAAELSKYEYLPHPDGVIDIAPKGTGDPSRGIWKPLTDKAMREYAVSKLVQTWAGTSNDHNMRSLALQEAAIREFDLKGAAPWKDAPAEVKSVLDKHGAVYQRFLRVQYELTQADFAERGITHVDVQRGMAWAEDEFPAWAKSAEPGQAITAPPFRPLSSWTVNPSTAEGFASIGNTVVLGTRVPASAVLSWPRSGLGCLNEYELVLLHAPGEVTVRRKVAH